jgi:NAD(P)-dependent dehydrogenase (short-subunit alcohol dehydrogenase family)
MESLDGKRVIVTGGAGGIGNAAVHAFVAQGAQVACTYNTAEPEVPAGVVTARCDIGDKQEVDVTFDAFVDRLGGLDALVHAAGVHGSCPADRITEDEWDRIFRLNGKATLFTNQAAFRHLRERGGSVVNMGSCEGVRGMAGNAVYAASRGAVMSFTRSIALEWGRFGVRVNAVAPVIYTRIAERMRDAIGESGRAAMDQSLAQAIPLGGKMGDPADDLAPVLTFLVSDASRFVTGQTIAVDGGFMMLGS